MIYGVSGQLIEWTRSRITQCRKTPSPMDTVPNGHKPERTRSWMDTLPNGHLLEWTQSQMGTIPNGYHLELFRMDTILNGHHPEWIQSRMSTKLLKCCMRMLVKDFLQKHFE